MKKFVNDEMALRTVMQLLKIEGVATHEAAVANHVVAELVKSGVSRKSIVVDKANRQFPFEAESGNVIAKVSGRGLGAKAKPRMFSAHIDTVGLASRAKPIIKGNRVVTDGSTALGADNRAGVAVILTLIRTLAKLKVDHPPLVLIFTVCEETGLWGSHYLAPGVIKKCEYGFNFDGSSPSQLVVAAPSEDKFSIDIHGVSSHAGVAPEKGASAAVMFAKATATLSDDGWLGRVRKGRNEGTSNIGVVSGGIAMNIVPPHVKVEGEARSYSDAFLARMIGTFRKEFTAAAKKVRNREGSSGRVKMSVQRLYNTFDLDCDSGVVREAVRALEAVDLKPVFKKQFGGLDANWLNAHGLPTVTLGAGGHNQHAVSEYLDVREHLKACEMALRMSGADLGR